MLASIQVCPDPAAILGLALGPEMNRRAADERAHRSLLIVAQRVKKMCRPTASRTSSRRCDSGCDDAIKCLAKDSVILP
jgi:hypothetical protein